MARTRAETAFTVYDPSTDSVSLERKPTVIGGAISTVRSAVEGRPSQEPDPELGVGGTPARATAAQSGYPNVAKFLNRDEDFMIYRRFAFQHARALLHQQDELRRLQDELDEVSGGHYSVQEHRQSSASSNYKFKLLVIIEEKLPEYSE